MTRQLPVWWMAKETYIYKTFWQCNDERCPKSITGLQMLRNCERIVCQLQCAVREYNKPMRWDWVIIRCCYGLAYILYRVRLCIQRITVWVCFRNATSSSWNDLIFFVLLCVLMYLPQEHNRLCLGEPLRTETDGRAPVLAILLLVVSRSIYISQQEKKYTNAPTIYIL